MPTRPIIATGAGAGALPRLRHFEMMDADVPVQIDPLRTRYRGPVATTAPTSPRASS